MILKKDKYVMHPKFVEWGVGKVLDNISGTTYSVYFTNIGYKKFNKKNNPLEEVNDEIDTEIFDNLLIEKDSSFQTISDLEKNFLDNYENGFNGQKYKDRERNYKDEAHQLAIELLNKDTFQELINNKQFNEILLRSYKIINKTNLIFPNEKMAFKDGFVNDDLKEEFSNILFNLLYKEDNLKKYFEIWILFLKSINANKWTIASYFQFIFHPNKYMFIKPTITQEMAKISSYNISYTPELNWNTYDKVQKFADYLKERISNLKPKDMIDVQSYMWCVSSRNN
jgi:hypothetical protein